jgi:hypothetical protein
LGEGQHGRELGPEARTADFEAVSQVLKKRQGIAALDSESNDKHGGHDGTPKLLPKHQVYELCVGQSRKGPDILVQYKGFCFGNLVEGGGRFGGHHARVLQHHARN